jgi:hypothetical protein
MKEEYILCAAIWYKDIPIKKEIPHNVLPVNCDKGLVFCGYRHTHCMYTMVSVTGLRSVEPEVGEHIQGFLTSKNRFVDREEGAAIHTANGHKIDFENRLFSEDLY